MFLADFELFSPFFSNIYFIPSVLHDFSSLAILFPSFNAFDQIEYQVDCNW